MAEHPEYEEFRHRVPMLLPLGKREGPGFKDHPGPISTKPRRTMSTTTIRARLLAQGFCGLNDRTYELLNYPLRLAPAICMVWAAAGTALASVAILWALVPFAALGASP